MAVVWPSKFDVVIRPKRAWSDLVVSTSVFRRACQQLRSYDEVQTKIRSAPKSLFMDRLGRSQNRSIALVELVEKLMSGDASERLENRPCLMFSLFEVFGVNSGAILRKSETLRCKLKTTFHLLSDTFYSLTIACIVAEIQHDELAYI
jgi:hypothetical protein